MKSKEFYIKEEENHIDNYQSRILHELTYHKTSSFNQLWNKEGRSNNFSYHITKLVSAGLIKKNERGLYQLTTKGKKRVAYMESFTGNRCELPIVAVIMIITDKDQVLLINRKKEPFYGFWAAHGGKLRTTNYIMEQAEESIKKETGLKCDLELKGIFSSKSYIDKEFSYGHQLFVVKASNPQGKLIQKTIKGENKWFKKEEIKNLRILPNIPYLIKIIENKKFCWIEADRFFDGEEFGIEVKKEVNF